ncbi:hypothetical protein [Pseudomonas sp. NMS19W]|uniref:hypothetical protein n=1 Tax=Pseudomonas sp. NMS19W TaxID=3079768 RepID=UPI003F65FC87
MEEVFIVQKRPAHSSSGENFYYRIVNIRTGEPLMANFLSETQAEERCNQLNERTVDSSLQNVVIPFGR